MADQGITLEELTERFKLPSDVLKNEVSVDDIKKISTFLESWKLIAPCLGLSEGDIEAIDRNGKSEEEKRLLMLQRWKQAFIFKATYKKLVNALLSIKRADLALNVCQTLSVVSSSLASFQPTTVGTHLEGQYIIYLSLYYALALNNNNIIMLPSMRKPSILNVWKIILS